MPRVNLLGDASIEAADGPVYGRGAQRRRIAVLAILAIARRPISRDRVIGVLWPDTSSEKARKLLSESLYVLRRALGEHAIGGAGDDVWLDLHHVTCDVVEFESAMEAGDLETAVARYRGPLLDGFFMSDASEFEHWLDGERARLARLYTQALHGLAERADQAGDRPRATALWRRLCEVDPYNSTYALELMRRLDAGGDRAAALAHARVHMALMSEEFGAAPDPAVAALAAQLRETPVQPPAGARTLPPAAAAASPEPAHAPIPVRTAAPVAESTPLSPAPVRRWRTAALLSALAALVLVTAAIVWRTQSRFASAASASDEIVNVAVFPFRLQGEADLQYLATGAATMLAVALDGAGPLRAVDYHRVLRAVDEAPGHGAAMRAANRFGARWFVLGSIVQMGSDVQITADVHDADGNRLYSATKSGAQEDIGAHFDAVARDLITSITGRSPVLRQAISGMPIDAIKVYLAGDAAFRAARYEDAVKALQLAVQEHPDNALAYYRLSAAAEWSFDFVLARSASARARAHTEQLPARYAQLVHAWDHFLNGRAEAAERAYSDLATKDSDDLEAWAGLAEVFMHFNPVRGRPLAEARVPLAHVLELDSTYGEARFHMLELAVAERDSALFHQLYQGLDTSSPQYPAWQAVRAFTWGDAAEQQNVLKSLASADELAIGIAAGRLAAHAHEYDAAARVTALLTDRARLADWRAAGELFAAQLDLATGAIDRALQRLDAAEAIDPAWSHELRAVAALHPANTSDDIVRDTRARVEAWNPTARTPRASFFLGAHADVHTLLRPYLLSVLSARLRDREAAERWRDELVRVSTRHNQTLAAALSASARARIALLAGDTARATQLLLQTAGAEQSEPARIATSPFFSHALDRLLLAELSTAAANQAEANRWYASLSEGYDIAFAGVARERRR